MPTFQFYATDDDASAILDFALSDLRCRLFDAYSRPDRAAAEYHDVASALAAYPIHDTPAAPARVIHLALWNADLGPTPTFRRVDFAPGAVPGHAFWTITDGWGLLQLCVGRPLNGRLLPSSISSNSEARARRWEDTLAHQLGQPADWNWINVGRVTRRLQYHIARRLAVSKRGARPVLPGADAVCAQGVRFAEV